MNDELENQIPAQDCELEYWLQQAENYAAVQIPADDLRAIIARIYAAVNALPGLLERVKRYEAALTTIGHSLVCAPTDYAEHNASELLKAGNIARAALQETGQ